MIFPIPETTQKFLEKYPFLNPTKELLLNSENELLYESRNELPGWKLKQGEIEYSKNKYAIIVFGKTSQTPGVLTSDGKLRIFTIVQHFLNGVLPGKAEEIAIVFTGHKSEAIALETFFRATIAEYNLDVSKLKIFKESEATTSHQNAKNTKKILKENLISPSHIFFCSTDWHVIRMWWNYLLVKEKSEICVYQDYYKNIIIEPLFAPYSYRERSQPEWMQWRSEFHIYTHFMAPLVSYLFAIGEKEPNTKDTFCPKIRKLFIDVFLELMRMTQKKHAIDDQNHEILDFWTNNLEFLDSLASNVEKWSGKNICDIDLFHEASISNWTDYAKSVNQKINAIRWTSDPDRT